MSLQKIININAGSCGDNDSRCGRESPRQTELSVTDTHLFLSYSSHLRIANQQEHQNHGQQLTWLVINVLDRLAIKLVLQGNVILKLLSLRMK